MMTDVILFNHALGVTDGLMAFTDRIRGGGHRVTIGDLFDGETFDAIDEGVAHEEAIGWEEMIARSEAARFHARSCSAGSRSARSTPSGSRRRDRVRSARSSTTEGTTRPP